MNDYLVDFTGGWAKTTQFTHTKENSMDEARKKALYDEILKALSQKYLIGCMKYDETKLEEDFDSDKSDDGAEDEAIFPNCMHNILDAQLDDNGTRLIYLVNYWPKGKWTGSYSVEDETWEANKPLAERLHYQVSQSDGTFWMSFDDWLTHFNRVYYCRIFPDNWSQFCIEGKWTAMTSGGAPPKKLPWYPEKYLHQDKQNYGYGLGMSSAIKSSTSAAYQSPSPLVVNKRKTGLGASAQSFYMNQTPALKSTLGHIEEERTFGAAGKGSVVPSKDFSVSKGNINYTTAKRSIYGSSGTKDNFMRSGLNQTKQSITSSSNQQQGNGSIDISKVKTIQQGVTAGNKAKNKASTQQSVGRQFSGNAVPPSYTLPVRSRPMEFL